MKSASFSSVNRRDFVKAGAVAAGLAALPSLSEANVLAGPNERINVAQVGIGGKGNHNRKMLLETGLCNIVALCDIDLEGERTLQARISNGDVPVPSGKDIKEFGKIERKAPYFTDFRKMFDKLGSQIDAVVISTPDHTHFPIAMAAMALGKHVWIEKPLAHTFGQCQRLIKMAEKSGVATQMGNQGHSSANRTQFESWTKAGAIQDVTKVIAHMNNGRRWHGWGAKVTEYPQEAMPKHVDWESWTGPAPKNHFSFRLHPANWRCWFDYGCGALGDWAPHILDTCHRYLKLGLPETVTAEHLSGPNKLVYPQETTLRFSFPAREEMPACDVWWYDGKKNLVKLDEELSDVDVKKPGKLIFGKDRVFQGGSHSSTLNVVSGSAEGLPEYEEKMPNHWHNFLQACKGEAESNSPVSVGAPLTQVLALGMIAQRLGGTIEFDRENERITNNEEGNRLLDPAPRSGWEEYYRM